MTKGRGGPQRGKEVLAMFGRRPMSAYRWEPFYEFWQRMTTPEFPSEPTPEARPVEVLQREGKPFAWALQTIDNRWRRRGRRGGRR
jgi:NAD-dependent SIR2 family protein deacetylase